MKTIIKQLAIVTCGAFLLAGCSTTSHSKAWEYKTLTTLNQDGEGQLNSLGKDGWVVVGFTYTPGDSTHNTEYHYVLKRPQK